MSSCFPLFYQKSDQQKPCRFRIEMNFRVHLYKCIGVTCIFFHVYLCWIFSALNVAFYLFVLFLETRCFLFSCSCCLPGFSRSLCTCQRTKHCRGRAASAASRDALLVWCSWGWVRKDRGGGGVPKTRVEGVKKTRSGVKNTGVGVKKTGWGGLKKQATLGIPSFW